MTPILLDDSLTVEELAATVREHHAITDDMLAEAASAIGREHGHNAGTWVFDGNTTRETYATILKGIEDGDPMVMEMEPGFLSGEWADSYDVSDLARDLGISQFGSRMDIACNAYQDAASTAYWAEVETTARGQV